jgi:hypothetical protein
VQGTAAHGKEAPRAMGQNITVQNMNIQPAQSLATSLLTCGCNAAEQIAKDSPSGSGTFRRRWCGSRWGSPMGASTGPVRSRAPTGQAIIQDNTVQ